MRTETISKSPSLPSIERMYRGFYLPFLPFKVGSYLPPISLLLINHDTRINTNKTTSNSNSNMGTRSASRPRLSSTSPPKGKTPNPNTLIRIRIRIRIRTNTSMRARNQTRIKVYSRLPSETCSPSLLPLPIIHLKSLPLPSTATTLLLTVLPIHSRCLFPALAPRVESNNLPPGTEKRQPTSLLPQLVNW